MEWNRNGGQSKMTKMKWNEMKDDDEDSGIWDLKKQHYL